MSILFTLIMNCQLTEHMKVSVSGTINNFVPAIVAVLRVNRKKIMHVFYVHFDDVCTLMMHCNDTSI